jgi:aldehyde dehydrogenase (NAD+)
VFKIFLKKIYSFKIKPRCARKCEVWALFYKNDIVMVNPVLDSLAPNASVDDLRSTFEQQRRHQYAMARTTVRERIRRLRTLYDCLLRRQAEVEAATLADFGKNATETQISELGVVLGEIRHTTRHLAAWVRNEEVSTPLTLLGASSEIRYQPKGVCLIISPWNFPFNLSFAPLVSAIAAGNCAIIKPSEITVRSSALIRSIVAECFPPEEVAVFEGDSSVSQALLDLPFNHIFFTGSPAIGKIVMTAAARHLSSVTLELGGKSPVIVDPSADLDAAAAALAWTKSLNAGQICIAPDYVLAHESIHDALVVKIGQKLTAMYGTTPEARQATPDYCRLSSHRHYGRVKSLLDEARQLGANVAFGGQSAEAERYLEPTVLTHVPDQAAIWREEIFGPVLPVRKYATPDEAIAYIQAGPTPLALYIFSRKKSQIEHFLRETRSGGVAINECAAHFYNMDLPFGGVDNSGVGKCHGLAGFREFSNARGVLHQSRLLPSSRLMMPPYGGAVARLLLRGILRWF